jgi:hypothetical protein
MSRKKISTTIYVTPEQSERLRLLHERTKVPVAVYIREGIDLVLRQYGHLLPGQLPLAPENVVPPARVAPVPLAPPALSDGEEERTPVRAGREDRVERNERAAAAAANASEPALERAVRGVVGKS